ncbi:DEAD/DEAH box helicase [Deinococcus soli (ex Cha et al. 2016)]|uniref:Superfamily II DNA or RNA helicase n=2 Tax=Deinococcus soli (ex Cha et al. 2016) TaxID=1309411 RepID=A0AAE3XDU8_9DEIO|nr:DEAD/DEAH box helicase [Deinococcus soli (ex Cha et al. 2016)]MDR6218275.1 superfamily II DNA or RNA helicase [Deinococcus soli (ex Cha et al. 2016)]MDR6329015.1 superfamily II DNA or RNA helicase [Deinococcus soli (ex Cha et al. 2016)]MDR6751288.1 superfamily II DNA or RNA helicase [Deinococcus soli (ex Cha et al. 2016)]
MEQILEKAASPLTPVLHLGAPNITPFPYQRDALAQVLTHYQRGLKRQLVVLPTGTGKTKAAAMVATFFRKTLMLVTTEEILNQTVAACQELYPDCTVGVIRGRRCEVDCDIVVAIINTVDLRRDKLAPDLFDLVYTDEAHHSTSPMWQRVLTHFTPQLLLGGTATPGREDDLRLDAFWEAIVFERSLADAVRDGHLVPVQAVEISTDVTLSEVRVTAGDYNERDLSKAVNTPERNELAAVKLLEYAARGGTIRSTIVFTVTIEHAQTYAATLRAKGVAAEAIWGQDPLRAQKIDEFRRGVLKVLVNAGVLTEGADFPFVSCVQVLRPTRSKGLYQQMVGRGLRLHAGKINAVVLDLVDNLKRGQRLVVAWDFLANTAGSTREELLSPGQIEARRLAEEAKQAAEERRAELERERRLRQRHDSVVLDQSGQCEVLSGPLNIEAYDRLVDLLAAPPHVEYHLPEWLHTRKGLEPATARQISLLKHYRLYTPGQAYCKADAWTMVECRPATPQQLQQLIAHRFDVFAYRWTHKAAEVALMGRRARQLPADPRILAFLSGTLQGNPRVRTSAA